MNEPIVELHEQVAKLEANLAVAQSFARRVTRLEDWIARFASELRKVERVLAGEQPDNLWPRG